MSDTASDGLSNMFLITIEEGKPRVRLRPVIPATGNPPGQRIPVAGAVNECGAIIPFPIEKI